MKHLKRSLLFIFVFTVFSCQKEEVKNETDSKNQLVESTERQIGSAFSMEYYKNELAKNPELVLRRQSIEAFTANYVNSVSNSNVQNRAGNKIVIPVVFNVLWNNESEKISRESCQSQIDVLNDDFNGTNDDYNSANFYNSVRGRLYVKFTLDKIVYKYTPKIKWDLIFGEGMKNPAVGGIPVSSPRTKLNFWVVGKLFYDRQPLFVQPQLPGMDYGPLSTDGVIVRGGQVGVKQGDNFRRGRALTYAVAIWMNVYPIWGLDGAECGDDLVSDTPTHDSPNFGNNYTGNIRSTCPGKPFEMYWNFMDETDDFVKYMFTKGQANRMRATFAAGGPRSEFDRE